MTTFTNANLNIHLNPLSSSSLLSSLSSNTNYLQWEWYQVYHFIMSLKDNRFIKYSQLLHNHLKSENINGIKLQSLTENHWFTFGITDPNDVQILIDCINKLCNQHTKPDTRTKSTYTPIDTNAKQNDKNDANNNDNIYMIKGNLLGNINSTLYQHELQKNQLINNCNLLYLYAQQINKELQTEHSKRINFEQTLLQLQQESTTQQTILNDALLKAYNQQSYLAANYSQLQNNYNKQTNTLQDEENLVETFEIKLEQFDEKYNKKCDEYKQLLLEHKKLQNKYNEMNFKLQSKCSELEYKYTEINDKYITISNEKDKLTEKYDKMNNIKHWDFNDVYIWIISLDNGYFERYESLYESLEIQNINGEYLCEFDVDHINSIGINDVMDQRRLLANIRILIKNCSDSIISDDNSLYDFANIDLFGN